MSQDPEKTDKVICQSHCDRRRDKPKAPSAQTPTKAVRQCVINDPGSHGGPIDEETLRCANHCVEAVAVA